MTMSSPHLGRSGRLARRSAVRPGRRDGREAIAVVSLLAWTSFLLAALGLLHAIGGPLAPPPLADPSALGGWAAERQPAEAAFAIARLLTVGLAWYLLAVTVVGTAARLVGAGSMLRVVDALTVPVVRRLVNGAVGVSLAAVTLTGAGGTALAEERTDPLLPDAAAATPVPTMQRLPDQPTADTLATTPPADGAPAYKDRVPPDATAGVGDGDPEAGADASAEPRRSWTVQPGEHFWAVAERVLGEAWSRAPGDGEVDSYWRTLVDANRAQLHDPANPDLLFPGQVLTLPAPPAPPA